MDIQHIVQEVPLSQIFLMMRMEQYSKNDQVMTLGDKEMIDELAK